MFFVKLEIPDVTFVPEEYVFVVHGIAIKTLVEVFVFEFGILVVWIELFMRVEKFLIELAGLLLKLIIHHRLA